MSSDASDRHRWNARYLDAGERAGPSAFLTDRASLLPRGGRALDLAGGDGGNAVWLAARGLDVTLVDVSDVACARAREHAAAHGVALDVQRGDLTLWLPAGTFDVVLCHHFLDVELWGAAARRIAPGGLLLVCQPTVVNLERHPRPSRRWLVTEGQMAQVAAALDGFEVLESAEDWTAQGRHEAHLVARRVSHERSDDRA